VAENQVYQLRLYGAYGSASWSNIFHYVQTLQSFAGEQAGYLAAFFETDVLPELAAVQNEQVVDGGIEVVCLPDMEDYANVTPDTTTAGTVTGQGYPATVAMQYKATRPGIGYRSGFKRFVGASESQASGNQWGVSSATAYALATAMEDALTDGDTTFAPVIVAHPTELGVNPAIRYLITEWVPQLYLSSQVGRKTPAQGIIAAP